jgi:hypothetical protein
MFLPLLEAMQPTKASAAGKNLPQRFAVLYMPNGVHPNAWTPKGRGAQFELSPVLAPLTNVKSDILVLTDLMNKNSIPGDGHYAKVAPFLTGTAITKTTGSNLRCGSVSLDQLIAQHVGHLTPLPSLELSTEPPTTYVDTNVGYTALYGSHISWSNPTTPVSREINPQLAFDRLFHHTKTGQGRGVSPVDKSVLDLVQADAKRLKTRIGNADRQKLEEYFEAVRSVEKRIAFDAERRKQNYQEDPEARKEVERLGGRIKDYYQDPAKMRERGIDHTEQVRLMLDMMVLGFWTDSTRVATFMFGNEVTGRNFSFLPGVSGGHHQISHHENDKAKMEEYKRINIWHLQQYAYMLEKMKAIKEGEGNLLDNSAVLFGAGMRDGNAHSPYNLPLVLAGKCGGKLATGRHLHYEKNTPLCSLYHGILSAFEVPVVSFGDSTSNLPGLFDPKATGTRKES